MKRMHITNSLEVWHAYSREIGDNGRSADACIVLRAAPQVGEAAEIAYVTTNGDPVLVGELTGDADKDDQVLLLDGTAAEWWDSADAEWLRDLCGAERIAVSAP